MVITRAQRERNLAHHHYDLITCSETDVPSRFRIFYARNYNRSYASIGLGYRVVDIRITIFLPVLRSQNTISGYSNNVQP